MKGSFDPFETRDYFYVSMGGSAAVQLFTRLSYLYAKIRTLLHLEDVNKSQVYTLLMRLQKNFASIDSVKGVSC